MRKILLITGKDVHNKNTFEIYKELLSRGFSVDVYATTIKDSHTLLFDQMGTLIKSIYELNEAKLSGYDYILSAIQLFNIELFRKSHKYVFINPSTYLDEVYFSGDFVFSIRDLSKNLGDVFFPSEKMNYIKTLPAMATGGATQIKRINNCNALNKILFIDAGHFPFGSKKELADYIVQIAKYCKGYEVRVKPRYLPEDIDTSHKNKENVLFYLDNYKELPDNLVIIRKHTDLQQELDDCDLVICSEGTTSYIEAILRAKRLIIFTGFPSDESVLWTNCRRKRFLTINSHLKNRVYYKDIFEFLPEGIETNGNELDGFLYKTENVVEDLVDAMEYIYENGISKNIFPKRDFFRVDSYKEDCLFDCDLTWNDVIQKRYKTLVYDYISAKIIRVCCDLECEEITNFIESQYYTDDTLSSIKEKADSILYDIYIKNSENMMEDAYSQSILCLGYFKKGRFEEFKPKDLKCVAYYNYCMAKIEYNNENYENALRYINLYFDEINNNLYEISYADDPGVIAMAHFFKGAILYHLELLEEAKMHLTICNVAWNGTHKKATELLKIIMDKELLC